MYKKITFVLIGIMIFTFVQIYFSQDILKAENGIGQVIEYTSFSEKIIYFIDTYLDITILVNSINLIFGMMFFFLIIASIDSFRKIKKNHKLTGSEFLSIWINAWKKDGERFFTSERTISKFVEDIESKNSSQIKYPIIDLISKNMRLYSSRNVNNEETTLKFNHLVEKDLDVYFENVISYENNFSFISIVSTPLGFLGTILGLIKVSLASSKHLNSAINTLLPGMKDALVTTMLGLFLMLLSFGILFAFQMFVIQSKKEYNDLVSFLNSELLEFELSNDT